MESNNTDEDSKPVAKNSVWNIEFLLHEYTFDYIPAILSQCWAIDEMNSGLEPNDLISDLWNSYEVWAEDKFLKAKERQL